MTIETKHGTFDIPLESIKIKIQRRNKGRQPYWKTFPKRNEQSFSKRGNHPLSSLWQTKFNNQFHFKIRCWARTQTLETSRCHCQNQDFVCQSKHRDAWQENLKLTEIKKSIKNQNIKRHITILGEIDEKLQ